MLMSGVEWHDGVQWHVSIWCGIVCWYVVWNGMLVLGMRLHGVTSLMRWEQCIICHESDLVSNSC